MVREDLFFRFGAFGEEIERKHRTSEIPPAELLDQLVCAMEVRLPLQDTERIHSVGRLLIDYFSMRGDLQYLNHPIRVAASLIEYMPEVQANEGMLALVHNLFERTDGIGLPEVNSLAGSSVLAAIRLLNIDRRHERDTQYLSQYYAEIRQAGRSIRVLKALDKLDNLLGWTVKVVDPFYYDVILKHVLPMLERQDECLRHYLKGLLFYVLEFEPHITAVE